VKFLRRLFTHNVGWKLGSLLLAVLLWWNVVGEPQLITVQTADVYYKNLPDGFIVISDTLDSVELELRGPSRVFDRENLSNVKVQLDLSAVTSPGVETFAIGEGDVTLPEGVELLAAIPARLFLEFDRRSSKEVQVSVNVVGQPAEGYHVSKSEAVPPTVTFRGPESRLKVLDSALTDAVDITALDRSIEIPVKAYVADPQLQLQSPVEVTAIVTIEKGPASSNQ
jgi:YbbR domain-containing protein